MAGYLFALGVGRVGGRIREQDIRAALERLGAKCAFGPHVTPPKGKWAQHHEGTLADFAGMRRRDRVFFICDRRIFGICELVEIGEDVAFSNFPGACDPTSSPPVDSSESLLGAPTGRETRWVCLFKPSPHLFLKGIDIDDALSAYPQTFRVVRTFERLSFIKLPAAEVEALEALLLRNNRDALLNPPQGTVPCDSNGALAALREAITPSHRLDMRPVLLRASKNGGLTHEMALEAATMYSLTRNQPETGGIFGAWDYLSHQVPASPPKPSMWMDRIDVFGIRMLPGFPRVADRFLCCELKRAAATPEHVEQIMKYVDWVKDEYAAGDYSMIDAILVAREFPQATCTRARQRAARLYTHGRRPPRTEEWRALRFVRYAYDSDLEKLEFSDLGLQVPDSG